MKCKVCGEQAIIKLKSHHSAFCKEHFIDFFERRVEKTISNYKMFKKEDKILVAVSGGKDSLTLLHFLNKKGYKVKGYHINLGIKEYSKESIEKIEKFIKQNSIEIKIENAKEILNHTITDIRKRFRNTCSICGKIKRYLINRAGENFDVIATGHNLDDETSRLLGNLLHWHKDYIKRQEPLLKETESLKKKAKPFIFNSEFEIAAYAFIANIDYVTSSCPFSKGATTKFYKKIFNKIENEMPGTKINFLKGFYTFKKENNIKEENWGLKQCNICGYPTYEEICSVCKLIRKIK